MTFGSRTWRRISPQPDRGDDPGAGRADRGGDDVSARHRGKRQVVRGVVGWMDFDAADAVARIDALAARKLLVGLRPMVQDIPDDDWLLRPALAPLLAAMARNSLVFDALVLPRHLPRLLAGDRQSSRSAVRAGPLRQAAACDRRDRDVAARYRVACRTPQHRLQTVGTCDGGRAGLADRGSAPGGGSCPRVLRAATPAVGKRLAGGQSGGRLCEMVRRGRNLAGRSVTGRKRRCFRRQRGAHLSLARRGTERSRIDDPATCPRLWSNH